MNTLVESWSILCWVLPHGNKKSFWKPICAAHAKYFIYFCFRYVNFTPNIAYCCDNHIILCIFPRMTMSRQTTGLTKIFHTLPSACFLLFSLFASFQRFYFYSPLYFYVFVLFSILLFCFHGHLLSSLVFDPTLEFLQKKSPQHLSSKIDCFSFCQYQLANRRGEEA